MRYPEGVLGEDEEVVRHLHPHWGTVFWPVVRLLLLVGGASFCAAAVPRGAHQGLLRLVVLGVAVLLLLWLVARPLLRWSSTHYVLTTHRLLLREGALTRRGRDIGYTRISEVTFRQTLWERIVRSGTVTVHPAGEGGATVLAHVPDSDGVQALLQQLVEEAGWPELAAEPGPGSGTFTGTRAL